MNISIPVFAMNDFLLVINAYGAFLKQRELVKTENTKRSESLNKVYKKLNEYKTDVYSYAYREFGSDSGLSPSELDEIQNHIHSLNEKDKQSSVDSLISTEKYYKKLKHQFIAKYPELKSSFENSLKSHQEYLNEHKRTQYQNHNEILSLSDSFIAFFDYHFPTGNGTHLATSHFFLSMNKKYNLVFDKKEADRLTDYLDTEINKDRTLNIKDIDFIADLIEKWLSVIKDEDIENTDNYLSTHKNSCELEVYEEKKSVAKSIIIKDIERFTKLLNKYKELKNELNTLI